MDETERNAEVREKPRNYPRSLSGQVKFDGEKEW